jgi:hypothetical protein
MTALAGKECVVYASTTGLPASWNAIMELKDANLASKAASIDVSQFGDSFMERILGLKDTSLTLSGFWEPDDTTGQIVIRDSWLADSDLYIAVAFDGTNGFSSKYVCSTFGIQATVAGSTDLSITVDSTGPLAAYVNGTS